MVSPKFLRDHGVEVIKVVQHPREFIVNYAGEASVEFCKGLAFPTRIWKQRFDSLPKF